MKTRLAVIITLLALVLTACAPAQPAVPSPSPSEPQAMYHKLTPQEAKEIMDSGEAYILLDVRTQAEYDEGHIEGAILIPDNELQSRAEKELPDKAARILLYCRSGRRSAASANALVALGYTQVYDFGGIIDWPYETR